MDEVSTLLQSLPIVAAAVAFGIGLWRRFRRRLRYSLRVVADVELRGGDRGHE